MDIWGKLFTKHLSTMKQFYLLLAALSAAAVINATPQEQETAKGIVMNESGVHADHTDGKPSSLPSRMGVYKLPARAVEIETADIRYREPEHIFTMGYTCYNSFYSKRVRRGGAYMDHTWTNISSGYETGSEFEWTYDSPAGSGQGEVLLKSKERDLTVNYPFNDGWWNQVSLTSRTGLLEESYTDKFIYRFGGPSRIVFSDATLDFGMTSYSQMLYADPSGRRTTTFGSLKYAPTAGDPHSVTKWTSVVPGVDNLRMKGFYNVFHAPDSPYAITKIWGWIEYTALKETTLTMTLYKLDEQGGISDEVVAVGTCTVPTGSDKSLIFDLKRPGKVGETDDSPITIDFAFAAVLEGFAEEGTFSKVLPILGSGTVWQGSEECPWPHNCGVLLSWNANGTEEQGYFIDNKVYDETTGSATKLGACDFLWMVDGDFAWIFEKSGLSLLEIPAEGGAQDLVFNSYYPLDNEYVSVTKDADWIEYTLSPAAEVASESGMKVTAGAADTDREGHIFITGPAMNYKLTVRQSGSSGVETVSGEDTVVSTEYVDMTGRIMAEAPTDGLYIRVDTYSNGTRKVTKVCK